MLRQTDEQTQSQSTVPWWRESQNAEETKTASETVTPANTPTTIETETTGADIWAELEAEALHRSQTGYSEVIATVDTEKHIRLWNKRSLPWLLLMASVVTAFNLSLLALMPPERLIFNIALCAFLWLELLILIPLMLRAQLKRNRSHLRITPQGIGIEMTMQKIDLMTWDEIAEVRMFSLMGFRYIGFVPKNLTTFCASRDKSAAPLIKTNDRLARYFYRPLGMDLTPIFFPLETLTVSAEETIAEIQKYHPVRQPKKRK